MPKQREKIYVESPFIPPFSRRYSKVLAKGNIMAFDFPIPMLASLFPNPYPFYDWEKDRIVDILNGEMAVKGEFPELSYDQQTGIISTSTQQSFIVIRGWGHLTGQGGMKLLPEEAAQIQNDFAQDIINRLNP
jgi:hypothetical protein